MGYKKSRWVRFRDGFTGMFKSLFSQLISFIQHDKELQNIFKLAGEEMLLKIKELETNTNLSGAGKRTAVRKFIEEVLKRSGIQAASHIINLAIEMALAGIRGR